MSKDNLFATQAEKREVARIVKQRMRRFNQQKDDTLAAINAIGKHYCEQLRGDMTPEQLAANRKAMHEQFELVQKNPQARRRWNNSGLGEAKEVKSTASTDTAEQQPAPEQDELEDDPERLSAFRELGYSEMWNQHFDLDADDGENREES